MLIKNNKVVKCRSWATSVTIPNSVTSIGLSAFSGCKGLTFIAIPNSVISIGGGAFAFCIRLNKITIDVNKDLQIGSEVFEDSGLEQLIMNGETIPNSTDDDFAAGYYRTTILNVPSSLYDKYRSTSPWSKFSNIVKNPNEPTNQMDGETSAVIAKISAIGTVEYTDACKIKIDDASTAYDALTDAQKALVTNFDVLTTAKQTYETLKTAAEKLVADKAKADDVIAKISAIGKVEYTDACKGRIDDASTTYDALTDEQKALVTNLDVLTIAKQTYEDLKAAAEKLTANKAKADPVIAKINAIGNVEYTDACKGKIDDASKAYDVLTDEQKVLVTNFDILTTAKQTYETLKAAAEKLVADKAKADDVIAKISAIGKVEYTDACKGRIDDASTTYDALTDEQKALVTNLDVLTTAKQTYETLKAAAEKLAADKAKADAVIAKISAIGKVKYTDACKKKIDNASNAYNALTDDQKALVSNLEVLTTAKQTYETLKAAAEQLAADKAKADDVIAKINAIGNVEYTDACKGKMDDASTAYNALTADQKALVTNLEALTTAKQTYEELKAAAEKLADDKVKADAVIAKISAIGKVKYTDVCKKKIDNASTAYEALTDDQKALVTNLDVLTMARQTYEDLKAATEKLAADKAKADAVIARINAIGNVEYTEACKGKIDDASTAYDALTDDQKVLVSNIEVLTTAQQTYNTLKAAADELMAYKVAFENYKSELKAIIEALGKEDDSDVVNDIIRKAISDIDALEYDVAISLDDNKAKVLSFVNSVDEAVEKQRAEDQETTDIEKFEFAEKYNLYDLSGKKISRSMLKSGLYIRNGKKVVVK